MDEKKVVKNVVSFGDCKFLFSCVCSLRHFELARMCYSFFLFSSLGLPLSCEKKMHRKRALISVGPFSFSHPDITSDVFIFYFYH